jgi:hypothetical protein
VHKHGDGSTTACDDDVLLSRLDEVEDLGEVRLSVGK